MNFVIYLIIVMLEIDFLSTVKPLLTTTTQQRPPLNYDHLFLEKIFSLFDSIATNS